jgi:hypothetical protein
MSDDNNVDKEQKNIGNADNNFPDTWFPCFTIITKDLGLITSAVFGNIWTKCGGDNGFSYASQKTIASELKLSKSAVIKSLKTLLTKELISQLDQTLLLRPKKIDPRTRSYVANIPIYRELYPYQSKKNIENDYTKITKDNLELYKIKKDSST